MAVSTTDLIQSVVMSISLIVIVFYGIHMAGGWNEVVNNATSLAGYLSMTQLHDRASASAAPYSLLSIISTLAWGLGYFGMPHILLRFMAISDPKKLKLSRRVASVWVVISLAIAVVLGVVARAMTEVGTLSDLTESESKAETLIVQLADHISLHGFVFALVAGLIIAGILASTMSTADSQLIAASSAVSEDIIQTVFGVKLSEKQAMIAARVTLIVVAVLGIILAWNPNSSVFNIVSFAWAGFGAVFGPLMLVSLFWKRANKYGAVAGMVSGMAMVFIWKFLVRPLGGHWNLYELAPAFTVSIIFIVLVSLVTPKPADEIVKAFDEVKEINKQ